MNTKLCVRGHGGFLLCLLGCSYPVSLGTILSIVCNPWGLCVLCVSAGSDGYAAYLCTSVGVQT